MITSSVVLSEDQRELLVDVAAARTARAGKRFSMSDVIREIVEANRSTFETEIHTYYQRRASTRTRSDGGSDELNPKADNHQSKPSGRSARANKADS
jgi:hypothetical protein